MKILVVDSNLSTYRVLSSMLSEFIQEIECIDTANTRDAAISLYTEKRYDLIFVAASYREGSGYSIIKDLREMNGDVFAVVYGENFKEEDYQKMIRYQVLDILKLPVTKERLGEITKHFVEARNRRRLQLINDREKLAQKANEMIEFSFIYSVLFNGDLNWEWHRYQYLLNISGSGYVIYISLDKSNNNQPVDYERYAKALKKNVTPGYRCIVGREVTKRIVIFVMAKFGLEKDRNTSRTEQIRYGKYIRKYFKEVFSIDIRIGIGSEKPINKLPISYEEALRNLRMDDTGMGVISQSAESSIEEDEKFYAELEQKFLTHIREGSQEALNNLSALLELMDNYTLTDKKNKILELLVMASHIARYDGKNESEYTNYMELGRQLDHMDEEGINAWTCRSISYIVKSVRDFQNATPYSDVRKVLRYIDNHYDEDITLEEGAGIVNLSPQYFSRVFREQAGVTFVDYLTKVRIRKAKEWLTYSNDTVQEICFKVGYKDPNYFARVFKKTVGVTPKQFKARKMK